MRKFGLFFAIFIAVIVADQFIKFGFAFWGWGYKGEYFSLVLAYNKGVSFSMFAWLGESLKFIQLALVILIAIVFWRSKRFLELNLPFCAILLGAAASNLLDRFTYGAVVDYVYWHKWFEFAIFNLADVLIDISIAGMLIREILIKKEKNG